MRNPGTSRAKPCADIGCGILATGACGALLGYVAPMNIHRLHAWDLTPKEAVALQRELASRVVTDTPLPECETIAGADVSYNRFSSTFYAGVVVVRVSDGVVLERRGAVANSPFPYVPGLLSFREAPALLEAFAKIKSK